MIIINLSFPYLCNEHEFTEFTEFTESQGLIPFKSHKRLFCRLVCFSSFAANYNHYEYNHFRRAGEVAREPAQYHPTIFKRQKKELLFATLRRNCYFCKTILSLKYL